MRRNDSGTSRGSNDRPPGYPGAHGEAELPYPAAAEGYPMVDEGLGYGPQPAALLGTPYGPPGPLGPHPADMGPFGPGWYGPEEEMMMVHGLGPPPAHMI